MWGDVVKTIMNVSIGAVSVFVQVFQQIQPIVSLVVGLVTLVYLIYQIKKIRLDIQQRKSNYRRDGKTN